MNLDYVIGVNLDFMNFRDCSFRILDFLNRLLGCQLHVVISSMFLLVLCNCVFLRLENLNLNFKDQY